MDFPGVMYQCDIWTIKKAECQRIGAFELWCWRRLLREIKPVSPKGNQSWIFIGRTVAATEAPMLWPPDVKSWLIRKDPDAWEDWRPEKKSMTRDKMVGWHHQLDGHEFEQAPGNGEQQDAWHAAVHGVTKSRTRLSNWTTTATPNLGEASLYQEAVVHLCRDRASYI